MIRNDWTREAEAAVMAGLAEASPELRADCYSALATLLELGGVYCPVTGGGAELAASCNPSYGVLESGH